MTDFDDRLRGALSADDEEFLKNLEDGRGLFSQMGTTFQGPLGIWTAVIFVIILIATGLGFYTVWQMFHAETTRGLILWTAGAWAAWTMQIQLKKWVHDRMNTLTILRELKKIELRVARLEK